MAADDARQEVAAVDLGSNSFHMMVARADGAELQVIDRLRESVRLAAGLDAAKNLNPEVRSRALDCLHRFGERLRDIPAQRVRVVGTSTMRRMKNGADFIVAAERALGHGLEVISGVEEARLVYQGVTHGLPNKQQRRLVVDIGGGSSELVIGEGDDPRLMESIAVGCVVHTQKYFGDGDIDRRSFNRARVATRVELEYLERRYRRAGWDVALGSSGTIRGVWRVLMEEKLDDSQQITAEGLNKLADLVIERGHVSKLDFKDLREDRRPVFAGGLAVLCGVFDGLAIERMQTSERALREGLIYDLLGRLSDHDIREQTVQALARRYSADEAHAAAVERSALQCLEQVASEWELDRKESAMLLGWAARLHEIGLVIAHSGYHKHGYYMLSHADLQGFSQTEQNLVAALVRLHRGKFNDGVVEELPSAWREPMRDLAIILRLAVLLHRSRMPDFKPRVELKAGKRSLAVRFPKSWTDKHPLTVADLEREAEYLDAIDFKLKFEEND
jgi:exopolyphosphatase/guanosine-5'-triphosphate,3'-diphosphate pyrophosphatase